MSTPNEMIVTPHGSDWHVIWPDTYRLLVNHPDQSRPEVFRAKITALYGDEVLTFGTIDLLSFRDRQAFQLEAASVNGLPPVLWPRRLLQACQGIQQRQQQRNASDRLRFQTIGAPELRAKVLPPQRWIIDGILPTGATLFVGRGKDGKSLLAWNLCVATAEGGMALGQYAITQGDVLYLALEDGERRAQQRLNDQMTYASMREAPARLELVLWDAPRLGEGFEERLLTWIEERPAGRLVVIDILEKVRPARQRGGSVYEADYNAIAPLQRIAQEHNIGLLIVHHSNKTKPEDFRDTASGSMGLVGACDTFWSLQRLAGESHAKLHIIGRDVEQQDLAMEFADGFWTILGTEESYRLSQASKEVLDALRTAGNPLTPKDLARFLGVRDAAMRMRLSRMADRREVLQLPGGSYIPRTPEREREGKDQKDGDAGEDEKPVAPVAGVAPVMDVAPVAVSVSNGNEGTYESGNRSYSSQRSSGERNSVTGVQQEGVTLAKSVSSGKDMSLEDQRNSVTGATGFAQRACINERAGAPSGAREDTVPPGETALPLNGLQQSRPTAMPRCPDGRPHTWIGTDTGRLCSRCNMAAGGSDDTYNSET